MVSPIFCGGCGIRSGGGGRHVHGLKSDLGRSPHQKEVSLVYKAMGHSVGHCYSSDRCCCIGELWHQLLHGLWHSRRTVVAGSATRISSVFWAMVWSPPDTHPRWGRTGREDAKWSNRSARDYHGCHNRRARRLSLAPIRDISDAAATTFGGSCSDASPSGAAFSGGCFQLAHFCLRHSRVCVDHADRRNPAYWADGPWHERRPP